MKAFLAKYKWRIIFYLVFGTIVLYFTPRQTGYYLEDDLDWFKKGYLSSFLIWTGIITSIVVLCFLLLKTRSIKQSAMSFIVAAATIAFLLFIFQDIFLGAALFVNRQFKSGEVKRGYVVNYMVVASRIKTNFDLYDITSGHISIDRKLINLLYNPDLDQGDTVFLRFRKGIFGIAYPDQKDVTYRRNNLAAATNVIVEWDNSNDTLTSTQAWLNQGILSITLSNDIGYSFDMGLENKTDQWKVIDFSQPALTDCLFVSSQFRVIDQKIKLNRQSFKIGENLEGSLHLILIGKKSMVREPIVPWVDKRKWDTIRVNGCLFLSQIE